MEILVATLLVILIYLIQNIIYKKYWNKSLNVTLDFSTNHIHEGGTLSVIEKITNDKYIPLPSITVKFYTSKNLVFNDEKNSTVTDNYYRKDIFSMSGNQRITRNLEFNATKRGYYNINSLNLVATNLFLSRSFTNIIKNDTFLYVFPKKINTKDFPITVNSIVGNFLSHRFINEDPFELKGIREYQPFDKMSSINWKSSAKTNTLMVNVNNSTSSLKVSLLLNMEKNNMSINEPLYEECIRIASSLSSSLLKNNIPLSFNSNGLDPLIDNSKIMNYGASENQLTNIDKALARIDLKKDSENFISLFDETIKNQGTDALLIIISAYRKDDLFDKFVGLNNKENNVIWILPYLNNDKINDKINKTRNLIKWEVTI